VQDGRDIIGLVPRTQVLQFVHVVLRRLPAARSVPSAGVRCLRHRFAEPRFPQRLERRQPGRKQTKTDLDGTPDANLADSVQVIDLTLYCYEVWDAHNRCRRSTVICTLSFGAHGTADGREGLTGHKQTAERQQ
jgi:hypothetical protein